jgi:hypothetical protein
MHAVARADHAGIRNAHHIAYALRVVLSQPPIGTAADRVRTRLIEVVAKSCYAILAVCNRHAPVIAIRDEIKSARDVARLCDPRLQKSHDTGFDSKNRSAREVAADLAWREVIELAW